MGLSQACIDASKNPMEKAACRRRLIEQMLEKFLAAYVPSIARRLGAHEEAEAKTLRQLRSTSPAASDQAGGVELKSAAVASGGIRPPSSPRPPQSDRGMTNGCPSEVKSVVMTALRQVGGHPVPPVCISSHRYRYVRNVLMKVMRTSFQCESSGPEPSRRGYR